MIKNRTPEMKEYIIDKFSDPSDFDNLCSKFSLKSRNYIGDFDNKITKFLNDIERKSPKKNNYLEKLRNVLLELLGNEDFEDEINDLFYENEEKENNEKIIDSNIPITQEKKIKIPSKIYSIFIGFFYYLFSKNMIKKISQSFIKNGIISRFEEKFCGYENFHQKDINEIDFKIKNIIINGQAGVGKSSLLDSIIRNYSNKIDLIIFLNGEEINKIIKENKLEYFWDIIVMSIKDKEVIYRLDLKPAALSYILNWKKVLLVIEDIHLAGSIEDVLNKIMIYFKKYHRWHKNIYIIGTSREYLDLKKNYTGDSYIIELKPMNKLNAGEFFFRLCTKNGIEKNKLTKYGEILSKAFDKDSTRTPLYIVICALMCVYIYNKVDYNDFNIENILTLSIIEIFNNYIKQLFKRSKAKSMYNQFHYLFAEFAHNIWPNYNRIHRNEIENYFNNVSKNKFKFNLQFLEKNGFLLTSKLNTEYLFFPHQSIADYLTSLYILRESKYEKIIIYKNDPVIDGIIPFIGDIIKGDYKKNLELEKSELLTFIKVLTYQKEVYPDQVRLFLNNSINEIITEAINWLIIDKKNKSEFNYCSWKSFADLLSSINPEWINIFCKSVENKKIINDLVIKVLSYFNHNKCDGLLLKIYNNKKNLEYFNKSINNQYVQDSLTRIMNSEKTDNPLRIEIFKYLWSYKEYYDENKWFCDNINYFKSDLLDYFISSKPLLKLLCISCLNALDFRRNEICQKYLEKENKMIIPCSIYLINNKNIKLKKPFIVSCFPGEIKGNYINNNEIWTDLYKNKISPQNIMDEIQFKIVYYHFSSKGVLFNLYSKNIEELVRNKDGYLSTFICSDTSKKDIMISNKKYKYNSIFRIINYHKMEYL